MRIAKQMAWIRRFCKEHSGQILVGLLIMGIGGIVRLVMNSGWFKAAGRYLGDDITASRYWMLIGIAACVFVVIGVERLLRRNPTHYSQDEIFGMLWEWSAQESTDDDGLRAFCPKCQAKLLFLGKGEHLKCVCAHCDFSLSFPNSDEASLRAAANMEIDRRLRTGEWRQSRRRLEQLERKRG